MFAFNRHIICALIALFFTIWLSSGTLSPYAASSEYPLVDEETGYLFNSDHPHFMGVYAYLAGTDRANWEKTMYLRRVLYPAMALPFIEIFGLHAGALIINFLVNAIGLTLFAHFLKSRFGEGVGLIGAWILAVFPGTAYWGSLPYPQTSIIPVTIIGFVLMYRVNEEESFLRTMTMVILLGVAMLAYDLVTYFGPVLMGVLFLRRKWLWMPPAAVAILLPGVLLMLFQRFVHDVSPVNINTEIYGAIINAYLDPQDITTWKWYLRIAPLVLVHNFFASCMILVPVAFVCCVLGMAVQKRMYITRVEVLFFLAAFALWSFSNLAPPYDYWYREMRSFWLARVFVPMTVPMVIVVARTLDHWREEGAANQTIANVLAVLVIGGHVMITFSGIARLPIADRVYYEFYRHSKTPVYSSTLDKVGRYPVGFSGVKQDVVR